MSENKPIQLGLCCLNTTLRAKSTPIFSSRSVQLKTFEKKGIEFLKEKIIQIEMASNPPELISTKSI